jgi:hypothetical protein
MSTFRIFYFLSAAFLLCNLFTSCKPSIEDKDWRVRKAAIENDTNQVILAKVAIEDEDSNVRQAAVVKIHDKKLLAKIAIQDKEAIVRLVAVEKINDTTQLAKIAIEDKDPNVRKAAVKSVHDQEVLRKMIIAEKDLDVLAATVENLTDMNSLSRMAFCEKGPHIRFVAIKLICNLESSDNTDNRQSLLARVVLEDKDSYNREYAFDQIGDQIVKAKVICSLNDSDLQLLEKAAGNVNELTRDARESIARIKLAIREPYITSHFQNIICIARVSEISRYYSAYAYFRGMRIPSDGGGTIKGEIITIKVLQNGKTLSEASWSTHFPDETQSLNFECAKVSGDELLKTLFHSSVFTSQDLVDLARSRLPEVRLGAVKNINDQMELFRLATEKKDGQIAYAIIERITDQVFLAKLALDRSFSCRVEAVGKIKDQKLLINIALDSNTKDWEDYKVAEAAIKRITDQTTLAKIISEAKSSNIQEAAIEYLTDMGMLEKVALGNYSSDCRCNAINKIKSQDVLIKVALEVDDSRICANAIKNISNKTDLEKIVSNAKNYNSRVSAADKLKDQVLLTKIICGKPAPSISSDVLKNITKQVLLAKVAIEHEDSYVRQQAVKKLRDKVILVNIAKGDKDSNVREASQERINELFGKK